ncbi:HNH endonuclease [Haladaptatus cibarius]|uniref:HNH endonuclease n=1 Tax=Haladaptatus cibarius TaxID=453847 RepID=UPI000A0529EC
MKNKRPENWQSVSRRVKRRDRYRCKNCNYKGSEGDGKMHAHHIVPLKDGGSNNMSNLITLCEDCHNAIHHKKKLAPTARQNQPQNELGPMGKFCSGVYAIMIVWFLPTYLLTSQLNQSLLISSVFTVITLPFAYRWHQNNKQEIEKNMRSQ